MPRPTLDDVERVLRSLDDSTGAIVVDSTGAVLADRDPLPGGGVVLVALGVDPPSYPTHFSSPLDARRAAMTPMPQGRERGSRPDPSAQRGSDRPEALTLLSPEDAD